jgi:hypothetical protein
MLYYVAKYSLIFVVVYLLAGMIAEYALGMTWLVLHQKLVVAAVATFFAGFVMGWK